MLRRFLGGAVDPAPAEIAPSRHLIDLRAVIKDYLTDAGAFRALRGVDLQVDEQSGLWTYMPVEHKTAYREKQRTIIFGPRSTMP